MIIVFVTQFWEMYMVSYLKNKYLNRCAIKSNRLYINLTQWTNFLVKMTVGSYLVEWQSSSEMLGEGGREET